VSQLLVPQSCRALHDMWSVTLHHTQRLLRLAVSSAAGVVSYGTVTLHVEVSPDSKPTESGTHDTAGSGRPNFEPYRSQGYCGSTVVGSEVTLSSTEP